MPRTNRTRGTLRFGDQFYDFLISGTIDLLDFSVGLRLHGAQDVFEWHSVL